MDGSRASVGAADARYRAVYDEASWSLIFTTDGDLGLTGPDRTHVFLCAGLQHPERMLAQIGRPAPFAPALVRGFDRAMRRVGGEEVPFLLRHEDPLRPLAGTLYLGLGRAEVERVEAFELAGGWRVRIELDASVGERTLRAVTYLAREPG